MRKFWDSEGELCGRMPLGPANSAEDFLLDMPKRRGRHRSTCLETYVAERVRLLEAALWAISEGRWQNFLAARSSEEIASMLREVEMRGHSQLIGQCDPNNDWHYPARILRVIKGGKIPKVRRNAQIRFLALSIAAGPKTSPRRSRDYCAKVLREGTGMYDSEEAG